MKRRMIIDGIQVEPAEARRIIDEAVNAAWQKGHLRSQLSLISLLASLVIFALGSCLLTGLVLRGSGRLLGRPFNSHVQGWVLIFGTSLLTIVITGITYRPLMRLFHRREIRAAMYRRGFDLCPKCAYWLKGLGPDSPRCPECGTKIRKKDE